MTKIIGVLIAVTLVTVAACQREASAPQPQAPEPALVSADANAEQVATQLVRDWLNAIPKRDTGRINEVLAEDFVAILPDGRKVTKAEHIKEVTSGSYNPTSFSLDQTSARILGDTAIVTYYQMEESKTVGQDTSGMSAWTDILAKRNGRWQVVAEHGSTFD